MAVSRLENAHAWLCCRCQIVKKNLPQKKSTTCGCQCLAVTAFFILNVWPLVTFQFRKLGLSKIIQISLKFLCPEMGIILAKSNLELSPLFCGYSLFYGEHIF